MSHPRTHARALGFSLVEVMAAVVIICVGLLGIAKLQALSLSNSNTSRLRALAAIQAASLAASMHSNREYWANVVGAPYSLSFNSAAAPAITSPSDAATAATAAGYIAAGFGNAACIGTNNGAPMCSNITNPGQLAAFDLALWANSLEALLPNPSATIQCTNSVAVNLPTSCTIQITWTEQAVAMTTQEAQYQGSNGTQQFEQPTYLLYVEP
jgi:type IV pilus assembly protein PilV